MVTLKNVRGELVLIYVLIVFSAVIAPSFLISTKNEIYIYFIKPLIWFCIFLITAFFEFESRTKYNKKKDVIKSIFIFTLLYLVLYYMSGLILGYNKSPYLFTFLGISKNILAFVVVACLQEYVRGILVSYSSKKSYIIIIITAIFILMDINWISFIKLFKSGGEELFKYICSNLLPLTIKNIAYTYIVYYVGYFGSIINRCTVLLFSILSPVIPNFDWFFDGLIQIIFYASIMLAVNYEVVSKNLNISKTRIKKESPLRQIPLAIISLIFILFIVGVFKYRPIAVMSNSMVPVFSKGAVVIVEKIDENNIKNLKVGDIIEYSTDKKVVLHRIIEIVDEEKNTYITKGDNNKAKDKNPVYVGQIRGIVRCYIPYIGYPSVWFSNIIQKNKAPVGIELGN